MLLLLLMMIVDIVDVGGRRVGRGGGGDVHHVQIIDGIAIEMGRANIAGGGVCAGRRGRLLLSEALRASGHVIIFRVIVVSSRHILWPPRHRHRRIETSPLDGLIIARQLSIISICYHKVVAKISATAGRPPNLHSSLVGVIVVVVVVLNQLDGPVPITVQ